MAMPAFHIAMGSILALSGLVLTAQPSSASSAATPGCGRAWTTGQDATDTLSFGGTARTAIVHVPAGYNPQVPMPLVLNLHAYGSTAAQQEVVTGMSGVADQRGFLVVYPNGTTGTDQKTTGWNVRIPNAPSPVDLPLAVQSNNWSGVDDQGYLNALVAHVEAILCVDTSRVAMTGYSLGGIMAFAMACVGTPWLAAIAPVAATQSWALASTQCRFGHPVSLLDFHGEQDWVDSYWGWLVNPTVPDTVASYAQAIGCQAAPRVGFQQGDVVQTLYSPCHNPNVDVQLYSVTDGGHTWPGGFPVFWYGNTTYVISATQLMADFFATHPLQGTF